MRTSNQPLLPCILSISGTILTDEEALLFSKFQPCGVVVFSRNISSVLQLKSLTSNLRAICPELMIWSDEEGGRVSRLMKSGIIADGGFPAAYYFVERIDLVGLKVALIECQENYYNIGLKMLDFGINGNFAPVADLLHKDAHDVIGDRSFGYDRKIVQQFCQAALTGLKLAGVKSCIKHIPGHGRSKIDTHLAQSVVDTELEILEQTDFAVFKSLAAQAEFAMTAHVTYSALDPDNPVSVSGKAVDYIRSEIGFVGTLISDDIAMKSMDQDIELVVKKVLKAGVDLPLYCAGKIYELEIICQTVAQWQNNQSLI